MARFYASLVGLLIALIAWSPVPSASQNMLLGVGSQGAGFPSGAVACWNLDEASGQRNDSVGSNHLTDNNTVTQAAGKVGNAAQFTAANSEYLSIADTAALSTGDIDFTFTAWVYLDSKATSILVSKSEGAIGKEEYNILYAGTPDRFQFQIADASTVAVGTVSADNLGSPSTATWYFIVAWHDATANTVNIRVNNGTADSAATTGVPTDTAARFTLGAYAWNLSAYVNGRQDAVGLWKRKLTDAEQSYLYNSGNGRACGA